MYCNFVNLVHVGSGCTCTDVMGYKSGGLLLFVETPLIRQPSHNVRCMYMKCMPRSQRDVAWQRVKVLHVHCYNPDKQ